MGDVLERPTRRATTATRRPTPVRTAPARVGEVRIGISGWVYAPWRGTFYPEGLPQSQELAYASRQVRSIEINGTFYGLRRPKDFLSWKEDTPDDFIFSVKGGRFLTHIRRLDDVRVPLANFLASGVLALGEKLGPLLWQLPPNFPFRPERVEAFLAMLPHDHAAAARLAAEHDHRVEGRSWLDVDGRRPMRHAMEVRHPSFADPAFVALLRRHGVAAVVADAPTKWPVIEDVTADFVYARLHGEKVLYASGYDDPALDRWAACVRAWRAGREPADARRVSPEPATPTATRDVFVYFDNDVKVHAPYDAARLAARVEGG